MLLVVIFLKKKIKKKIKGEPPFFKNSPRCLWFGIFFLGACLVSCILKPALLTRTRGSDNVQRDLESSRLHRAPLCFPAGGRRGPAAGRAVRAAQPMETKRREMEL